LDENIEHRYAKSVYKNGRLGKIRMDKKALLGCALTDVPSSDHPDHRKIYLIKKNFTRLYP